MTDLYDKHLAWTEDGLQLDRLTDMKEQDLRPEIQECKTMPSESNNGDYLVAKVDVLDRPFEAADISADQTEIIACSCSDWYFNLSAGIEHGDIAPSEIGVCKHGRAAYKAIKAQADESQTGLDEI